MKRVIFYIFCVVVSMGCSEQILGLKTEAELIGFIPLSEQIIYTTTDNEPLSINDDRVSIHYYSQQDGIGVVVLEDDIIGKNLFSNTAKLKSVIIPNSITSIGKEAFENCTSLTSVIIPDSVTSVGEETFYNCPALTSITIPDSVTNIRGYVFYNCSSLTSVTIPDSVTSIGYCALYGCSSLKSVYCKPTTPPAGGQHMFDQSASGRKIYVPYNSVAAYKQSEYWSRYASDIVGYDFESGTVVPENPENPETPENPENPDTPETPENPDTPDTPENPDTPEGGGNEGGSTVEVFTLNGSDLDNIGSIYTTTMESFTATDGSVWKILGYCKTKTDIIQLGAKNNNYILTPATTNGIKTIKLTCSGNYYVALWDPLTNELISGMVAKPSSASYDGDGTITFTLPAGYKQVKIISTRMSSGTGITSNNAATYIKKIVVTSK